MVQKRNFPDFIEAYTKFVSGHEGTPKCHLWSILSVLAASLERKVWIDRGYYTLFPNLYVFIIGRSGLIKKSTTTGIAVDLFRALPDARMMSERLTAASLINQLCLSSSHFEHQGERVNQAAVFAYASELSVMMAEVSGSITELLTTFFDCIPNDSNKPWVYDTKTTGVQKIYGPCLNILGASTKSWLKRCIPASEMEGGFSSRVVFVVENNLPKKLVAWPEVSRDGQEMREKLIDDLCMIHSMTGPMVVSPKARELFAAWYETHMTQIVPEETDPRMSGYLGRKGDLLLKVSMLRAVSLREEKTVEVDDVYWAGRRLEELELDMRAAFEGMGSSPSGEITFEIRNFIRGRAGWVEKSEIKRSFAKDAPGHEIERCLNDLIDMGEIEIQEQVSVDRTKYYFKTKATASGI